ncbi:MAG TPA: NADH:ubiquinone reductase (Na(+)-transporting) subunit C [Spirochaetota bacterium]|nr:NADH:ubiquinone reductase (Na(+)-transporting) subunit C [Spirochaetota bacterium]
MRQGNAYTLIFLAAVALAASLVLSLASHLLKERQVLLQRADMKRNILIAAGFMECYADAHEAKREMDPGICADVHLYYQAHMRALLLDHRGKVVDEPGTRPELVDPAREAEKPPGKRRYPVFLRVDSIKGKEVVSAYCIPIYGKGLWSSLYGYLALEPDLNTVKGLTFHKQGETPGLGAEIQSRWFQDGFKGKKILDGGGNLVSITVLKGKLDPSSPQAAHLVDGISGATLTTKGVTELLMRSLSMYEPYFTMIRRGGVEHGSR